MSEHKNLQEQALEATVYLPVGTYLAARDEIPKLKAKGKAYVTNQMTMARTVGNFAVTFGSREAEKQLLKAVRKLGTLWGERPMGHGPAREPSSETAVQQGPLPPRAKATELADGFPDAQIVLAQADGGASSNGTASSGYSPAETNGRARTASNGKPAQSSARLAIVGYDSLSASQVVQRLAGLEADELEAVRAYEAATRGRTTVLNKATQLLAPKQE